MNLLLILGAGFETVYTALSYSLYVLTRYPDEMKKLQDEIDSKFKDENVICA